MPIEGEEHYQKRSWITITELSSFACCPRKFFYKVGCGLKDQAPVNALVFGEAMHKAIPIILADQDILKAMDEFNTLWDDTLDDPKRNRLRALAMLTDFLTYRTPPRSIYAILEPPGGLIEISDRSSDWEIPFAIDIGLDIPLCGRIDGWAQHRDYDERYALEFKTSSEVSQRLTTGFEMNPQIIGYASVLKVMGYDVKGTILDVLRVSNVRSESHSHIITVTDVMSDSFLKWAKHIGEQILACEEAMEFPQQWSGCNPYAMFGMPGRTCEFARLCRVKDWTSFRSSFEVGRHIPFDLGIIPTDEDPKASKEETPA